MPGSFTTATFHLSLGGSGRRRAAGEGAFLPVLSRGDA